MASNDDHEQQKKPTKDSTSGFECNICLETAKDAVLSRCGHLFCWPCIHQWLEIQAFQATCPVCKSSIAKENFTPIYGRNSSQTDPRTKVPPRPSGTRQEPPPTHQNNNYGGFADGGVHFQMSFGFGAFPFGLFQTSWNNYPQDYSNPTTNIQGNARAERYQQELISHILLGIAVAVILFIIFN